MSTRRRSAIWGVTSNFGQKGDSHQFDGWCHDTRVCDNAGTCQTDCTAGWYEWNSCTDHPLYRAPNCSLFNANSCTEQVSTTGTNVHGTKVVDVAVSCPADSDGDGIADRGGCADVKEYSSGTNFLSLYELDPVCCDQLVQTVYYPAVTIPLSCNSAGCTSTGSSWLDPVSWDSPATPPKVFAQMAVVVNSAVFVDTSGKCPPAAASVRVVNAASYSGTAIAPESIATIFGTQLASATGAAAGVPLPTVLAGASVVIKDEVGSSQTAPLFYVSPGQINFLVPATAAVATIRYITAVFSERAAVCELH